jgi:uncharacterized Zn finger protein
MIMFYNTFTEEIHALILHRGRAYFTSGAVRHLTQTPDGWSAEVTGQQTYHVVISGKQEAGDWYCDCPHDHGPVCKHVAAVMYAIRDRLGIEEEE